MMTKPVLTIDNLSVSFHDESGWHKAVEQVSFSMMPGQSLGIVGESGSGKSVTSLSVMRLLPALGSRIDSGRILYNGSRGEDISLTDIDEPAMRKLRGSRIAMIFQEPMTSLNPVMKCGLQLTEAIRLHLGYNRKKAKEHVISLFTEVLLPDPERVYNSYPHQLSGGQKQRVMIAMAIACRPDILIADEPTTALDVTVQKAILTLLRSLRDKYGMSLIFISHDLGVVAEVSDYVLVMKQGQIVEQGFVKQIFSNPAHPYTQGLLACRPPLDRRLRRLPVVSDFDVSSGESIVDFKGLFEEVTSKERISDHQKLYKGMPLLEIRDLSVHYPMPRSMFSRQRNFHKAVDQISFNVYKGETLGLVGESGCGKTTLGRALLRLIEPTSGGMEFDGINLINLPLKELRYLRKRIQIIFQDPYSSLNPRITAGQAILEPMQAHRMHSSDMQRKDRVMELLNRVNLKSEHYERYPHQFSGGQRQRICIARALALEPEFIICDESVSALDVSVQAQVLNLLNDLKKSFGLTYIFISHDLSVVRFMSDRMVVMRKGKIVEYGDSDLIYESPSEAYTRDLIAAIPGVDFRQEH
ncbi:MAG: ATPase component of various ABC-type transport systems with duplicated ATPase domain [Bacteroidetes bacterium]|nr:MAG: ATPase component of various ABC-type transport systems with duplicated ATPase domain [Bacteroidota bacterium]